MKMQRVVTVNRESGFVLATVLVFLVVLSLTAFLAARLTRTDVQMVNNLQNEKKAIALADAGVDEALYRLSLAAGDTANVPGIGLFTASITPQSGPNWGARTVFTNSAPVLSGTSPNQILTTPSLQPVSQRLAYSNDGTGNASNPLTETLTIGWDICLDATPPGCSGFPTDIRRKLPLSSPRPVIQITSTGQSGNARRTVTVKAVDCIPNSSGGPGSFTALGQNCSDNVALNGGNTITAAGVVSINAGTTSPVPASCTSASTGGAQSIVSATAINTVGSVSGNFSPPAQTGSLPVSDPYANIAPPTFGATGDVTTVRNGSAASPSKYTVNTNNVTIQPGIYYGGIDITANNVHMASGIYVMAGGGFSVGNNASVSSDLGGVMIYNTSVPGATSGAGAADSLSLTNGNTSPNIAAITTGPWTGFVFFQDRSLPLTQPELYIQGGDQSTRVLEGIVYAPNANLQIQGSNPVIIGGAMVVQSSDFHGNSDLVVEDPGIPGPNIQCGGVAYRAISWQDF